MPQDQDIRYRVNIDDADFQAKLSAMRSSIDMTMGASGMGGMGMMGGGFGMAPQSMLGGMGNVMMGTGGAGLMSGLADFGTQIRPVSFTPPAIAMTPHFGMVQLRQSGGQAALGMTGPIGMGIAHPLSTGSQVPGNISMGEYMALSTRAFAAHAGDAAATGALVTASTGASLLAGGAGTAAGAALFSSGVGKFVGGFLGGALGGMAVTAYTGEVADMMAQNRAVQQQLSAGSFRFISGGRDVDPLTGRGFSRAARADIANDIQIQELGDTRYGMNEYRQVLESGMQMDLFSGTHDAQDFKTKFKSLVENVKTVAATLHTSLQEGVEVIRGFRDMGVTDPAQINRMTLGSEMRGRASGRTGMEMMEIGQAGAEIFRGTGVNMARGFELNQMNTMNVRQMLDAGTLTRETVGQAGGELALGQQMTANALGSFQSALGRGALMANYNPATGQLNPNMIANMAGQNAMSMVQNAASLGNNPMAIFSLQANQSKLISSLSAGELQAMPIEVGMAEARTIAQGMGVSSSASHLQDIFKARALQRGVSEQVIDAQIAWLHTDPAKLRGEMDTAETSMRNQAAMEDFRNRFSGKRITNFLREKTIQPLQKVGSEIAGAVEQSITDFGIRLLGGNVSDRSTTSADIERGEALLNSTPGTGHLVDARGSAYQKLVGGASGDALGETFSQFGKVAGNKVTYLGSTASLYANEDEARKAGATGAIIGERDGKIMVLEGNEQSKLTTAMRNLQPTQKARDDAEKHQLNIDVRAKLMDAADKNGNNFSLSDAVKIAFGDKKDLSNLTEGEKADLERYAKDAGGILERRYSSATGTALSADASSKAKSEYEHRAADVRGKELNLLVNIGGTGLLDKLKMGQDAASVAGRILGASSDTAARLELRDAAKSHGVNLSEADQLSAIKTIRGISGEKKDQFLSMENERLKLVAEGQRTANAATGGTGDNNPASTIGNISRDTMAQIKSLADSNIKTMETLLRMQKEIGIELDKRGK